MRIGTLALASTIVAASLLAACSGGSTSPNPIITPPSSAPAGGGAGPDPNGYNADSVGAVNALGAPMQGNVDLDESGSGPTFGKCINLGTPVNNTSIYETYTPAAGGQPASTDLKRYLAQNCPAPGPNQGLISETVRSWMPSTDNATENLTATITKYQTPGAAASSIRVEQISYANSNGFNYGYPVFQQAGLNNGATTRSETTTISVGGQVVSNTGDEFVYGQTNATGDTFCGDQAGFNRVGDTTLDETFGWEEMSTNGSRAIQSNNQVVLSATRTGTVFTGPIGQMSLVQNAANTSCTAFTTPMFQASVAGGYLKIPFSMNLAYTFTNGFLTKINVSNAEFGNNEVTINITSSHPSSGQGLLTGQVILSATGTAIGQFTESINGFGTLTVGNNSYNIADWHVVD